MNELQTFGWYAARVKPHLPKEAFKPIPARLLGGLAYLLVTLAGILAISLLNLPFVGNLLISIAIGLSFAGMCFLGHEILHGGVVRHPLLKDFLGGVAFASMSIGPKLWRKWHNMNHHIHTQHEEKDPDTFSTAERVSQYMILRMFFKIPKQIRRVLYAIFLTFNFSLHSTRMFFKFIKEFSPKKQPMVVFELLIPTAIWIGLLFVIGPVKWIFAYVIPLMIANFIMSSYVATNHNLNPKTEINDPLANSLSVTVPKWVDILHFNFSYHTEHHLFPGMNPKFYPMVKEKIKEFWPERYHEMKMEKAMLTLFKTPRIYLNEEELVDMKHGDVFSSLGRGLNPDNLQSRKLDMIKLPSLKKGKSQ